MRGLRDRYVSVVCALAGVFHLGTGIWAFLAPRSFYQTIATFPPFNVHFLHDLGAFLMGIGVALLAALVWRDALFVALTGATASAILHWVSHLRDHHLGGWATDPWLLGIFALLLLSAALLRFPRARAVSVVAHRSPRPDSAGTSAEGER